MSNSCEINFWIRGDSLDNIRTFKVKDTSTPVVTRELKEHAIRSLGLNLSPLELDSMMVYKVPGLLMVDEDEDYSDVHLGSLSISSLGKPLRSEQNLLAQFKPLPSNEELHFIIVPRTYKVHCWCRGTGDDDGFDVRAPCSVTVSELKEMILSVIKTTSKSVDPDVLSRPTRLYKISAHSLPETLGALGEGDRLKGDDQLHHAFRDVPFSESLALAIDWHDEHPIYNARTQFLTAVQPCAPSRPGAPSSFRKRQREAKKTIPCGRPQPSSHHSIDETIPPTLLHPVFNEFVDDCQNIEVSADDNFLAQELRIVMSNLYKGENERVERVTKVLALHGIKFSLSRIQDYVMDGTMNVNGHYYAIAEFKNEIGSTSAEPYFESISYYLETTRESTLEHPRSPLPCLLLTIAGPLIIFSAAAWNLRPTVQVLPPPIVFHSHSTDIQNHLTIARHMAAFRKAAKTLKAYYENLKASRLTTSKFVFPYPTSYQSLSLGDTIGFQYDEAIDESKLISFATEEVNNHKICVKFVHTYPRKAHETLAKLGHAPSLRGLERLPGGQWIMVVFDALVDFQTLEGKTPISSSLFESMSETLTAFHDAGYVHGDIRDVNIMVSKTDKNKFMFVDFDWSGVPGEVRYPSCVNTEIERPVGAVDGQLITKDHDRTMLSFLRRVTT